MKVIHLGQLHKLPFEYGPTDDYIQTFLQNQLEIAQYLRLHSKSPVLLEGLAHTSEHHTERMSRVVQALFPNKIPIHMAELNKMQRGFLYQIGSVRTLHYLGELTKIHRAIHPEKLKEMQKTATSGDSSTILHSREEEAIICLQEVIAHEEELVHEVILVFGDFYDFNPHCKKHGYDYEKISCGEPENKNAPKESDVSLKRHALSSFATPNLFFPKHQEMEEKSYHVKGNLFFTIKRNNYSDFDLSVLLNGEKIGSAILSKREALKIVANLGNPDRLFSVLKSMESTTKIAVLVDAADDSLPTPS
ncbi:hypothetical protein [Legionella nagasakiensis]|uniref:hypothetical protein n=1 Tax=Legionella nagasakiensis TaxID=535290 RepID=UPI001056DF22|nr:hypothetical protein [Legionella nagasakiensis]